MVIQWGCPDLKSGEKSCAYGCTADWPMCHQNMRRTCSHHWRPIYCGRGYHLTKAENESRKRAREQERPPTDPQEPEAGDKPDENPDAPEPRAGDEQTEGSTATAIVPYESTAERDGETSESPQAKHIRLNLAKARLEICRPEDFTMEKVREHYATIGSRPLSDDEKDELDTAFFQLVTEVNSQSSSSRG